MAHPADRTSSAPPAFGVRVLSTGDRSMRVVATGELDLASSSELDAALTGALADADDVTLDLSNVTFIDSTGLSTILAGVSTSQLNGATLTIGSSLSPQARRLFQLAGMLDALPLADE